MKGEVLFPLTVFSLLLFTQVLQKTVRHIIQVCVWSGRSHIMYVCLSLKWKWVRGWWTVLCSMNDYLKTTITADEHTHIHTLWKPTKTLDLSPHLLCSQVVLLALHLLCPGQSKQTGSLFMNSGLCYCVYLLRLVWLQLCVWVCVRPAGMHGFLCNSVCVYVGFLTKRKWFLIVFLC